ncbi:MAG: methyltransferase domain-containing protein [Candidatus Wallbacteria bacterium]|nr:methyltransferase domain-containing protein [Candidatus Wallbacteria bacterium]
MNTAAEHVQETFDRGAGGYDLRWARYNLATHRATVELLELRGDERVLDIGCGTGELERHLLCRWPRLRIVAIDLCRQMLAQARTKFSPELTVRYAIADIERLPFPPASFDIVLSCNAFHFAADRMKAIGEVERVLSPGGTSIVTDWCGDYLFCRLLDGWLHVTGRAPEGRVLRETECRSLLEETRLEVSRLSRYRIGWFWGMMTAMARKPGCEEASAGTSR